MEGYRLESEDCVANYDSNCAVEVKNGNVISIFDASTIATTDGCTKCKDYTVMTRIANQGTAADATGTFKTDYKCTNVKQFKDFYCSLYTSELFPRCKKC